MMSGDRHEKGLPFTFSVGMDGETKILVSFPEEHVQGLDGIYLEDNNFHGVPEKLAPGLYKGIMDFEFMQGYFEGHRADGENDWSYTLTKYEKVG